MQLTPLYPDSGTIEDFYKQLAGDYHFIFADWRKSVLAQSGVLDRLIRQYTDGGGAEGSRVLDCACGIGTQALGLALRGYRVHATDLSSEAVTRAQVEARKLKTADDMTFGVADFRFLDETVEGRFLAVIACDNALAHVLTEADMERALRSMWAKVEPGGVLIFSIRDYDRLLVEKPRSTMPNVTETEAGKVISFQVWDWSDVEPTYRLNHFMVKEHNHGWQTTCAVTILRAWQRADIDDIAVGLADVQTVGWHMPETSGYYQPVFVAQKSSAVRR